MISTISRILTGAPRESAVLSIVELPDAAEPKGSPEVGRGIQKPPSDKKLVIPTDIKTEKTLRSILNGMGYFAANNLDHAGHPIPEAKPDPVVEQKKMQSQFVHDMRGTGRRR